MKVLNHLDLNGTELRKARIHNLASDPTAEGAGHIYYHTGNNEARLYNGSGFKKLLMDTVKAGEYAAGSIVNADVSASAAIARTKLDFGSGLVNADIAAAAAIAYSKLNLAGSIVNADINASAAIALSKLATDPLARANHTGTQTASTISDFDTQVRTNRLDQMAAPTSNVSINSQRLTSVADPQNPQDAATKAYVDAARLGMDIKESVRVISTSNQSLTSQGSRTIDSVSLASGNRVLLAGQTAGAENGIYTVGGDFSLTRATDADSSAEVTAGMFTWVTEGTTNADTGWVLTTDDTITLGSTSLTFTQFSGTGQITAGAGLTKSGNTIDAVAGDTSLTVAADSISVSLNSTGGLEVSTGVRVKLDGATLTRGASGLKVTDSTFQPLDADLTAIAALSTTGMMARTAADTYVMRTITGPAAGISVTNGNGVSGNPTLALTNDLSALEGLGSTGIAVRSASDTWVQRSVAGTSNRIDVSNGSGVSGNPTVDISSSYVGQASITTLGTIGTGTWQGTAVAVAYGGTGATTAAGARSNLGTSGKYSSATHSSGTTITIAAGTHGLGSGSDKVVSVLEVSSLDIVYPDVNVAANGDVVVTFASSVSANTHRVTILG